MLMLAYVSKAENGHDFNNNSVVPMDASRTEGLNVQSSGNPH